MMTEHRLKTLPAHWDAIKRGEKNFEVRRDDRGYYQKGDILMLVRLKNPLETGRNSDATLVDTDIDGKPRHVIRKRISYILTGGQLGIAPGYVVMALEDER